MPPPMWWPTRWRNSDPGLGGAVDWDRTLAFRDHLWSLGFGVAEAMDTAQRGMGLDWPTSLELIRRSTAAAQAGGHLIACGAGTDHLRPAPGVTLDDVIRAYEEQCEAVEAAGGRVILMASRALVVAAKGPEDYIRVYDRILGGLRQPAILHWLGEMFDPALAGYWGRSDHRRSDGHRPSGHRRLTPTRWTASRSASCRRTRRSPCAAACPRACGCIPATTSTTPTSSRATQQGHSHALLGIFDPIAGAAARALTRPGEGRPRHL